MKLKDLLPRHPPSPKPPVTECSKGSNEKKLKGKRVAEKPETGMRKVSKSLKSHYN